MTTSPYKAIPDPAPNLLALRESQLAAKEVIEVLTGQRKPVLASAVTWEDLVSLGLITPDRVPRR